MAKNVKYFLLNSDNENTGELDFAGADSMETFSLKVGDIVKKEGLPDAKILKIDEADFAKANNCDAFVVLRMLP